jgi:hypothetical protein
MHQYDDPYWTSDSLPVTMMLVECTVLHPQCVCAQPMHPMLPVLVYHFHGNDESAWSSVYELFIMAVPGSNAFIRGNLSPES